MIKPVFCIGGANVDVKLTSSSTLIMGTSNLVNSTTTFGGVARNVAENLAHWTKAIHFQSVIGNDEEGRQLLQHINKLGIITDDCLILKDSTTSRYYAVINQDGSMLIALADMKILDLIPETEFTKSWHKMPENSLVFADTNLPVTIMEKLIEHCQQKKIALCIDPVSVKKTKHLPNHLENIYLIKPNIDEAKALTNISINSIADCIKAGKILLDKGIANVVISLGAEGYVVVNDTMQKHVTAIKVNNVQDVTGAGDAFIAGIMYGLQKDADILAACEFGALAAAKTLQSHATVVKSNLHEEEAYAEFI